MTAPMKLDWTLPLRTAGTVRIVVDVDLDALAGDEPAAVLGLVSGFHDFLAACLSEGTSAPRLTTVPQ